MPISPFSPCWRLPERDKSAPALAECVAAKADLQFQLEELGHDYNGLQSDLASAWQVANERQGEIDILNAQIAILQAQLTTNENALQAELDVCLIEKFNIDASLFSANLRIGTLTTALETCETEKAALQGQIDGLNTQIGTLNNQISTLEYENSSLNTDKTALQSQVTSLNSQITTLNADKTTLQNQVTSLNSQITQLNADKTALQNQVNDLNAQITALNASNVKKIINSDAFLSGNGSLSFWIYPKSNNLLVEFHYNAGSMLGYYLYGNKLVYRTNLYTDTQIRTEVLNTWVFWQFIANGGITYKVYRNGVFVSQTPTNYGAMATMCKISHQLEADVRNLIFSSSTAVLAVPTRE